MKVLLLAENWAPRRGGIENYLENIALHLKKNGVEVRVIVPRAKNVKDPDYVTRRKFFARLIRPRWLGLFIWIWRYARREKIDVIICGKGLFEGLVGYYLKKHLKVPYVVCTYAMEIETWVQTPRQLGKLKRVLGQADRVLYINDQTKKRLIELGVSKTQLLPLQPGVSERFIKEVSAEQVGSTLKKYQLSARYVLSVGRLVPRKGFDLLIESFSQLDQTRFGDVQLVIVGDGPELKGLEKLIEQEMMDNSVIMLPEVPDEDLPALYKGAEVFIMTPLEVPGDMEGFGIVYLEAAAQGTPAISTATGGAQEAVVADVTGLVVEPESKLEIMKALTFILQDSSLRSRLSEAAKGRAHSDFAWDNRINDLIDSLRAL